jgi:RNA polymerase sigma-70 factor (ECF subfamily)
MAYAALEGPLFHGTLCFLEFFRSLLENAGGSNLRSVTEEKMLADRLMRVTAGRGDARAVQPGLIEACRRGDPDAFRVLFEACKDSVYSIALNFTGSEEAAEDVSQEVFLKLYRAIRGFRGDSEFRTWLFRLVVNACMDERRRRRRLVPVEETVPGAGASSCLQQVESREIAMEVRAAVVNLSPRLRLPILLRYVEGLSYEEIAKVLKCSMGTVASRLNRGHKLLAQRLSHLRGEL